MSKAWFDVDRDGLREQVASKPAWFAIAELAQNSWDEDSTRVDIWLKKLPGRPAAKLVVRDDNPEGFRNITHAFTLFARSDKRTDPEKRGRFNLGEKLVLARCIEAEVSTTKGTVVFNQDGTRTRRLHKRGSGTVFTGMIRMNQEEYGAACSAVQLLHPPIPTTFNGEYILTRDPITTFEAKLPTVVADDEGVMRRTTRKTEVRVYEPQEDERPCIYEMGIPVVETDDQYHVDVQQKVPLNMDRDNVPPSYLRKLRAAVLNHTVDLLRDDEVAEQWVDAALEDKSIEDNAVKQIIESRYGKKVVTADPSDREAENNAKAKGYTVVHGRSFSKRQWEHLKRADAIKPAGQVFPTAHVRYSAGGTPEKIIPTEDWTTEMQAVAELARRAAQVALGLQHLTIVMVNDQNHGSNNFFQAWYGAGCLHFNYRRLGKGWFRKQNRAEQLSLIIHELAHHIEANHLSARYHEACCNIGAKLVLGLEQT